MESHVWSWPVCRVPGCPLAGSGTGCAGAAGQCVPGGGCAAAPVLLQAGEHFSAGPSVAGTGSCDGEAAGTCMSVAVAQTCRTRLEVN